MNLETLIIMLCCTVIIGLTSCEKETITPDSLAMNDLELRKGTLSDYKYDASSVEAILEELNYPELSTAKGPTIEIAKGIFLSDLDNDSVLCLYDKKALCAISITDSAKQGKSNLILVDTESPILLKDAKISGGTHFDGYSIYEIE